MAPHALTYFLQRETYCKVHLSRLTVMHVGNNHNILSFFCLNLIKPVPVLASRGMSMHVKRFSDRIQHSRQACIKVGPQLMKIQIWSSVDTGVSKYLSLEFDQTYILSAAHGVSMHVKWFSDSIQHGRQAYINVGPKLMKIQV